MRVCLFYFTLSEYHGATLQFIFALRFNLALCSLILINLSKTETVKEMDETRYWPGLSSPHSPLQHSFYS